MAPSRILEADPPPSAHVSDPSLQPFRAAYFDPVDYLNDTLPPFSASSQAQTTPGSVSLQDLSTQTQTTLSQSSAHTARLSSILTQLTDEILRSGSRLAYEVEVLRGETLGLSEALTEGLKDDVALFVPEGLTRGEVAQESGATEGPQSEAGKPLEHAKVADLPSYMTQLRTLSLVKDRLDTVIKVFGDAMDWTLPPSEISITSSFISVSAPEPGSESHSREEKGQETAKKLRDDIASLLVGHSNAEDGLEAAINRVEELRELAKVWKGTAEEKARMKFVESLIRIIEDRQRALEHEAEQKGRRSSPQKSSPRKGAAIDSRAGEASDTVEQSRFGWPGRQGGYAFIDQLQKMRGGL